MKKVAIWIIVCLTVICSGCRSESNTVNMYATPVGDNADSYGNITMILTMTENTKDSTSSYISYDCDIEFSGTNNSPISPSCLSCMWYKDPPSTHYVFSGAGYNADLNCYVSVMLYMDADMETCVLDIPKLNLRYVASVNQADPTEILDSYSQYLS